ncbi:MAG: DUF1836 domain-containing protein [Clostridiales bacterium]|nr:DUF1836 domain-containing protein [Clostridiales bacterium]
MVFMYLEKEKLIESFNRLDDMIRGYSLPEWDELPDIELYMDQVITLISKYLSLYHKVSNTEKSVTPSMINNYVKLKTIPAPVRKRYSKIHLAYLLIVCTLKQTLDMSTIQKIVPVGLTEDEIKRVYTSFARNQKKAFDYVSESIKSLAAPILGDGNTCEDIGDVIMQVSASANFYKIMTEKITDMSSEDKD